MVVCQEKKTAHSPAWKDNRSNHVVRCKVNKFNTSPGTNPAKLLNVQDLLLEAISSYNIPIHSEESTCGNIARFVGQKYAS
jgi:hypothetical protein